MCVRVCTCVCTCVCNKLLNTLIYNSPIWNRFRKKGPNACIYILEVSLRIGVSVMEL